MPWSAMGVSTSKRYQPQTHPESLLREKDAPLIIESFQELDHGYHRPVSKCMFAGLEPNRANSAQQIPIQTPCFIRTEALLRCAGLASRDLDVRCSQQNRFCADRLEHNWCAMVQAARQLEHENSILIECNPCRALLVRSTLNQGSCCVT